MTLILQTFSSNSHTHFQWLFSRCHCSVLAWTSFPGLLLFCGLLYIPTHSSLENGTSLFGKGKWPSYPYIFKSQSLIPKLFSWRLFSFMKCSNVCSVLTFFSCSVLPSWQEKQRTALKHSWDFYPTILSAAAAAKLLQSCPTLRPHRRKPTRLPCPWDSPAKDTGVIAIAFSNAWKWKVKGKSLSHVRLVATPWTAAYQAPPSMGFSREEYWSGVPLPSPTILTSPEFLSKFPSSDTP